MNFVRKSMITLAAALLMTCMFAGMKVQAAAPGKVTGLEQIESSQNRAEVTWKPLSGNVGYKVVLKSMSGAVLGSDELDEFDEDEEYTLSQLTAGTSYMFSVQAYSLDNVTQVGPVSTIEVVTGPEGEVPFFRQKAAKATSITLEWGAVKGATGYEVELKREDDDDYANPIYVTGTSYEFKNLKKDSEYDFQILAVRKSNHFTAESTAYETLSSIPTLPSKVTGLNYDTFNDSNGLVYFNCSKRASADGYQCYIYDGSRKIITIDSKSSANIKAQSSKLKKKSKFFSAQVRAYVNVNGNKQFGAWSDKIYFSSEPVEKVKRASGGLKISWKKISGSTNYTVYVSNKKNSGFKKAGTTSKNSLVVRKYGKTKLKKGKTYYIYVVANKKVGKKTYTSPANSGVYIKY